MATGLFVSLFCLSLLTFASLNFFTSSQSLPVLSTFSIYLLLWQRQRETMWFQTSTSRRDGWLHLSWDFKAGEVLKAIIASSSASSPQPRVCLHILFYLISGRPTRLGSAHSGLLTHSLSLFIWRCNEKMTRLVQLEEAARRPGPFKPIIPGWRRRARDWEVLGGSPGLALLPLLFVSSWPSAPYRLRSCKTQGSHRENMKRLSSFLAISNLAMSTMGERMNFEVLTSDAQVDAERSSVLNLAWFMFLCL